MYICVQQLCDGDKYTYLVVCVEAYFIKSHINGASKNYLAYVPVDSKTVSCGTVDTEMFPNVVSVIS